MEANKELNKINFAFNTKCDTCQKLFKMVAVEDNKKICLECFKAKFKEKHKLNPDDLELDKDSEKRLNKAVDEIVKIIKEKNE